MLNLTRHRTPQPQPKLPNGTDLIKIITEHGFDERVAGLGGLFGAGVYFAEMCSKSDQYCTPNESGILNMFLSRVVFGSSHPTTVGMPRNSNGDATRRPPDMPGTSGRPHDSIVYRPGGNKYNEFIVYDKAQAYPEFLVEFKRE
jgi:hypothetical protein